MLFLYCFFGVLDTAEQMVIENISQWVHIWQKKKSTANFYGHSKV